MLQQTGTLLPVTQASALDSTVNSTNEVGSSQLGDHSETDITYKEPEISKENKNLKILPRKRLKPAVNLTAACRRRKENKDTLVDSSECNPQKEAGSCAVKERPLVALNPTIESSTIETKIPEVSITDKKEDKGAFTFSHQDEKCMEVDDIVSNRSCNVTPSEELKESSQPVVCNSEKADSVTSASVSKSEQSHLPKINALKRRVAPRPNIAQVRRSKVSTVDVAPKDLENDSNQNRTLSQTFDEVEKCLENIMGEPQDTVTEVRENETKECNSVCSDGLFEDLDSVEDEASSIQTEESSNTKREACASTKPKRHISLSSQRIMEAKRNFGSRFANKTPDRNSLRMLDLIYYNPTTNPMKSSQEQTKEVIVDGNSSETIDHLAEENVDNPDEGHADTDTEESNIPAPRVKVGPDGEIVLDEQSLVIETTESKRSRKEIANLTVVVDTGTSTTYGTYSKKKKIRNDWNERETLRFYKALQTFGTDFSLMQTLFPTRSRVALKAKFKKEERVHGDLVEKALHSPLPFDLAEFEDEPENDPIEPAVNIDKKPRKRKQSALQRLGLDEEDFGDTQKKKRRKRKPKSLNNPFENGENDSSQEMNGVGKKTWDMRPRKKGQECIGYDSIQNGLDVFAVSDGESDLQDPELDEESSAVNNQDEESNGVLQIIDNDGEPRILSDITQLESNNRQDSGCEDDCSSEAVTNVSSENGIPSFEGLPTNSVQPGSLVLFTTECPDKPGYHICNLFMVQAQSNDNNTTTNAEQTIPENTNYIVNAETADNTTVLPNIPIIFEEPS